jgi:polyisoprenoid-binding protein YceI
MKKSLSILVVVISLILIGGQQTQAAAPEWNFDSTHSRFYFTIDHIYAKVIGYFEDFSGTFHFTPDNLEASRIHIEIKAKSINTNIRKRDNHLRSDDFFGVKKYPLITFVSKRISHKEGNQYEVEGDLTIKDVTKSLVLPLTYFGTRDNPLQKGEVVAGFETRFTLNRLDYHVGSGKFYQMGVAGKDVDITVSLEMLREK